MSRSESSKPMKGGHVSLEARVKHVPEATIRKRWKKLPSSSHSAAREAILSAKDQSRSRRGRNTIDTATEECIRDVANKLTDRLPRIPFPPSTDEHYFDHEANINRISKVEEQLNANVHSMNLLRAQIAKEERLLKQDQAEVGYLEHSLKSNEMLRREQSKTFHPVVRKLRQNQHVNLLALDHGGSRMSELSITELFEDAELGPILHQLENHLSSLATNAVDMGDIKNAVQKAAVEVEVYAFSTLDEEACRKAAARVPANQT